jgi:protein-L-isoaspartate O-methyltransferase
MSSLTKYFDELSLSLNSGTFQKGTLSKATATGSEIPINIYVRPVTVKNQPQIAVTYRYHTRDEIKNYTYQQFFTLLAQWLQDDFREAVFFTLTQETTLKANRKAEWKIFRREIKENVQKRAVQQDNNRSKSRLIDQGATWLQSLGITSSNGQIRADAQDKWRQMNKYLEVIATLLDSTPLGPGARVVDMGAGKGYLTFALAQYLCDRYSHEVEVLGVELREQLVAFCNDVALASSMTNLQFVAKDIALVQKERIDMLIALHACDTATDLALYAGLKSRAAIIVVAPCCHKQVRKDMEGSDEVIGILEHGIMKERQAEMVTDVMRSLLLEGEGYKTKVFEFVGVEHTPKNVMITAERRSPNAEKTNRAQQKIAALKTTFGVKRHYLEDLIKE